MPIYEYECQSCSEKFEMFRSISDDDSEIKCPNCGQNKSRRVLSRFATGASYGESAASGST